MHLHADGKQIGPRDFALTTPVDDGYLCPRPGEVAGRAVGVVIVGEEKRVAAWQHAIAVHIGACRTGQHHARAIVAGKDKGPFDGAGGANELFGVDGPAPLSRRFAVRLRVIADALDGAEGHPVIAPENARPRQHAHILYSRQLAGDFSSPCRTRRAVNLHGFTGQMPAGRGLIVGEKHPRACKCCLTCRHQPGRSRPDDKHVAMGVGMLIAVRVCLIGKRAETGGAPDHGLIKPVPEGARPHKGLVVETRREERLQKRIDGEKIEFERGPAVLAPRHEAVKYLYHRRLGIGLCAPATAQRDQGIRLFGPGAVDAARTVIFEAPPGQVDAVGEQCGGQRVAGMGRKLASIKGEGDRTCPVDKAAFRQSVALPAHGPAPAARGSAGVTFDISWLTVSRVTTSHDRHPLVWCQYSSCRPAGFFRR